MTLGVGLDDFLSETWILNNFRVVNFLVCVVVVSYLLEVGGHF